MLKYLLLISCCFFSVIAVRGQSVFSGRVLEDKTRITLHGVRVENLSNKLVALTDKDGSFSIGAKAGDLIVFKFFSYQPDTLLLTDLHDKEVFMVSQATMLKQVTITDTSGRAFANKNAVQKYDPEFHNQTVVYQRDEKGNYKGGIALRLHYWKKDEHKKQKQAQTEKDQAMSEHISTVFTAEAIAQYVPLKGKDMDNFILLYIPDVKTYTSKSFNLLSYLNACYKEWLTLTPEQQKAGHLFEKE
ncbi:hypothetical protein [Mucilaginibacter sp.]|uniref:hypothetical protein n=1 Tax=Mucilaginibacter sp. TaxID=1882438 RepID=UPI003D0D4057